MVMCNCSTLVLMRIAHEHNRNAVWRRQLKWSFDDSTHYPTRRLTAAYHAFETPVINKLCNLKHIAGMNLNPEISR